jgi:hypothetical protein
MAALAGGEGAEPGVEEGEAGVEEAAWFLLTMDGS